jgi:hypothetical protein
MSDYNRVRDQQLGKNMKNATETFNEMKHRIEDNVVIWNSNDRHPMDDLMTEWLDLGLVTKEMFDATAIAREESNMAFFAEFKTARANRSADEIREEAFEMRAAFGPGVEVVNVITGERNIT